MTTSSSFFSRPDRHLRMFRRFLDRAAKNIDGAAAIEFGIIVPVLTLMIVAVADIGLGVYYKMQVEDAAQAGAEYAIRNGFDINAITNAVLSATNASTISASPAPAQFCGCATGSGINSTSCGTQCPGGTLAATYVTVSAQMTYYPIMAYPPSVPSSYNLTAQSTARLQ
jgi:Flp pilus assembly protein TadG